MSTTVEQTVQRILTEDVLTLQEARNELKDVIGRRPDKCTLYRWCLRGVKGVKLEHVRLGDRIITSRQALTRFIEARSQKAAESQALVESIRQRGKKAVSCR